MSLLERQKQPNLERKFASDQRKNYSQRQKKKQKQVSTCRSCNQGNYGIISQAQRGREKFMHF